MWDLTDHACRICLGRVLERVREDGVREVRCAECGVSREGGVREICACGRKGRAGYTGLRCERNANRTPEFPQEIVVAWVRGKGR